ncbi:MAG TPA: hypothetical protein VGN36_05940 [Sphingorhabdus sp.]|nr:hypothetical protein [Sphingorhabdus sp.]
MEISPLLIPIMGISCGLVAIFGGVVIRPWFRLKEKQMAIEASNVAEKAAQYASRQAVLEERVAVLERIITDQGYSLASEIEALRSLPPRQVTPQQDLI